MATFADIPLPEVSALAGAGPFAGAWAGYWGGVIPHVLLAGDGGPCVYAVGAVPRWGIPAVWTHRDCRLADGRLVLPGTSTTVEYWLEGPDTLAGRYRAGDSGVTWGRFVRVAPELLHSAAALPHPVWGEAVRIPHAVGALAGLWHAALAPPAPLAVLSHGSSDGVDPRMTITMEGEARWLREQGYAVLVPMRRGRGESDGVYGETNCCDLGSRAPLDCSAGLSEAVDDLRAAIEFGLGQSGVREGPVFLAGQSRGGFLSIVYAGLHPADVTGVISFVGGWTAGMVQRRLQHEAAGRGRSGGESAAALAAWGQRPLLWCGPYPNEPRGVHGGGGRAALHLLTGVPHDGHRLAGYPDRWASLAAEILAPPVSVVCTDRLPLPQRVRQGWRCISPGRSSFKRLAGKPPIPA